MTIDEMLEQECPAVKTYDPTKLPDNIKRTVYVTFGIGKYNKGNIRLDDTFSESDDSDFARVLLTKFPVSIDIPVNVDIAGKYVKILEKKKRKIQRQARADLHEVQVEINRMLCLAPPAAPPFINNGEE